MNLGGLKTCRKLRPLIKKSPFNKALSGDFLFWQVL